MLIGYARVSSEKQILDRQLDELARQGVDPRNIYQEKITGKRSDRPELIRMLSELQAGDTIIVVELTRLSRSTKDLLNIVEQVYAKGAFIKSVNESWLDTTSPAGNLMLTICAGLAQFERDLTSKRTKDGLESAKKRGRVGGRPSKPNAHAGEVERLHHSGFTGPQIARQVGISGSTIKRILRAMRERESVADC